MNKISQKMIEIAEKLSSEGLEDRAEQFVILAEDLENENKMNKMASSINIDELKRRRKEPEYIISNNLSKKLKIVLNRKLTPYNKYKD